VDRSSVVLGVGGGETAVTRAESVWGTSVLAGGRESVLAQAAEQTRTVTKAVASRAARAAGRGADDLVMV
jgi:hypothetical protein